MHDTTLLGLALGCFALAEALLRLCAALMPAVEPERVASMTDRSAS